MATSGNVTSNGYQGRCLYFEWSTQSISMVNNLRTIYWKVTAIGGSSTYYYHHDNTVELNGDRVYTGPSSERVDRDEVLAEGTYTIDQNNTTTLRVDLDGGIYVYDDNINTAETWNLDAIPRASNFTVSGTEIGSNVNVTITPYDNSFRHTVTLSFGNTTPKVSTNVQTSTSFSTTIAEYAPEIPNSTSGIATIVVDTYSGNNKIGSVSKNVTLTLPSSVVPAQPTVTLTEAVSGIASKFSAYIQNKSMINGTITASGIYGSTITQYTIYINGETYNTSTFSTNILKNSGSNECVVSIKDSRGRTNTRTVTFNVLEYQEPTIANFTAVRNDSTQTQIDCVLSASIKSLNNLNDHSIKIQLDYTDKYTNTTNYSVTNLSQAITGASESSTHIVRVVLEDYFYNTTNGNAIIEEIRIGTAHYLMNFSADGEHMAIGQVYDSSLPVDLQVRESLAVGGFKAFYRDANGVLASNTTKYTLNTITRGNNTFDVTFKRSGNVVTVTVVSNIASNSTGTDTLSDIDFPEWAKNYTETGVVQYTSGSTIKPDGYVDLELRKTTSTNLKYILKVEYSNTSSSTLTFRTTMTYIIED